MASLKPWFLLTQINSWLSLFHHQLEIPLPCSAFVNDLKWFCFKPFQSLCKCSAQPLCQLHRIFEFFKKFNLQTFPRDLVAGLYLHKPACVTTSLKVLDCPKARNYLLSGIWKFRNLSFPILQNTNVSFPMQATVSLNTIHGVPMKIILGKRFLGQASWLFSSWILLTIAQTNKPTKKFQHLAWLCKSRNDPITWSR